MQQSILKTYPTAEITVGIIWINILEKDTEKMAKREAGKFITDSRVRHFYDPQKRAGKAVAFSLGGEGEVAWDTYLFYEKGAEWSEDPPGPGDWMHQLKDSNWANPTNYFTGEDLVIELDRAMKKRFGA